MFCHLLRVCRFHHSMLVVCAEVMWLVFCLVCLFFVSHIDTVLPMCRVEGSHAEMAGIGRKQLLMLRTTKKLGIRKGKVKAFTMMLVLCTSLICQGKHRSLSTWGIHTHTCIYIIYIYKPILKQHDFYFESILSSSLLSES